MNSMQLNRVTARINYHISSIEDTATNRRTLNHLYHLKMRLIRGQKLTAKMSQNLEWIQKDLLKEFKSNFAVIKGGKS